MQNVDCTAAHISINDTFNEVCMVKLIKADFDGHVMQFNDAGWFNATIAASKFGKDAYEWTRLPSSIEYVEALERKHGKIPYLETKKGRNGGTWLHPKLAVAFARWLNIDFAIWCDEQIDHIIHGSQQVIDWNMARHATKSSNKVANQILQMIRAEQGKETQHFHYANEAKLVNYALTGKFEAVDRDGMSPKDLDLLASLENRNSVLLGREVDRETRKEILCSMASEHRTKLSTVIRNEGEPS